jgi:hypothetical protein
MNVTGGTIPNYQAAAQGLGSIAGATSDFFAAGAAGASIDQYKAAAESAISNEQAAEQQGRIRQYQAQRRIEDTLGAQRATVAAAGFQQSGTALDLMRDSTTQGAITQSMIQLQTGTEVAGFKAQENAAEAEAAAARGAAFGDVFGGVLKGAAGIASLAALL